MPNVAQKPSASTDDAAAAPTSGAAAKRYQSILRDFMAYTQESGPYLEGHEFTDTELSGITPEEIIRFFKFKLYGDGDVNVSDKPLSGSHHTLDYYKKAISSFIPQREIAWDTLTRQGNPTRAKSVNEFVRHIRELESVEGSSKKRKKKDSASSKQQSTTSSPTTLSPAKRARTTAPVLPGGINNPNAIMSEILQQVHQQNNSVIDFLGTLGSSIDRFRSAMQEKNQCIMSNIHRLNSSLEYFNAYAPPAPVMRLPTGGPTTAVMPPGGGVAGLPTAASLAPPPPPPPQPQPVDQNDWFYLHPDGKRRRVPPGWQFPSGTLHELYKLWHIGDPANRIYPMKTFSAFDVSMCGSKRSRTTLSEARCLCTALDNEVNKAGRFVGPNVSEAELLELFQLGVAGLDISRTTPTGRGRNINTLKWTSLVELGRKSTD